MIKNLSKKIFNSIDDTSGNGLITKTGDGIYTVRNISAGSSNIVINNGDGTSDNPSIDLNSSISISNIAIAEKYISGTPCVLATTEQLPMTFYPPNIGYEYHYFALQAPSLPFLIDGIDISTLLENDRILVKDQEIPTQNGIYSVVVPYIDSAVAPGNNIFTFERSNDYVTSDQINSNNSFSVTSGTSNGNTVWVKDGTIIKTLESDPINFVQYNSLSQTNNINLCASTIANSYTLTLPSAAPQTGQSLQSDASGNLSWVVSGGKLNKAVFLTTGNSTFTIPANVTLFITIVGGGGGGGGASSSNQKDSESGASSQNAKGAGSGGGGGGFGQFILQPTTDFSTLNINVGNGGTLNNSGTATTIDVTIESNPYTLATANGGSSGAYSFVANGGGGGTFDLNTSFDCLVPLYQFSGQNGSAAFLVPTVSPTYVSGSGGNSYYGGGGAGIATQDSDTDGVAAITNTGGGGGGAISVTGGANNGGEGGSGICIIEWIG